MPLMLTVVSVQAQNQKEMKGSNIQAQELVLTQEWDKTFPQSNKVNHRKVTFINRYGITLAADLYEPKDAKGYIGSHCSKWSFRCRKGAVQRIICANNG